MELLLNNVFFEIKSHLFNNKFSRFNYFNLNQNYFLLILLNLLKGFQLEFLFIPNFIPLIFFSLLKFFFFLKSY
jgi:hypothetical protein